MGRKIFVSYKFKDDKVENLLAGKNSTARDYVTEFENVIDSSDHIYKGESDDDDLSQLTDDEIWEKLKDRIYDSTVTVIFISPGMKEDGIPERDQWIPWEVSYSLKEISRKNKNGDSITSKSNAMVAVVLPDLHGEYSYYLEDLSCCGSKCTLHHRDMLFSIIRENKFNIKNPANRVCQNGSTVWHGEPSYIKAVQWDTFIEDYNFYITCACDRQECIEDYIICKEI